MKRLALLFLLPALALAYYDMQWFNLNHWKSPIYNEGRYGLDITVGSGQAGGSWPQPLHNCYVFGAGPWIGAVLPSPSPETLCTVMYNPNTGGTEMCPTLCRYWREGTGNFRDRIYKYPGDWPPSHSRFPMAPLWELSDMDMWSCFCDSEQLNHDSLGRPLGVDVYFTVYGFSDSLAQDFFFLRYELANCSGDSIKQAYFGMLLDADVGVATDDMAGLILNHLFHVGPDTIRVKNTGFVYDNDNIEYPGATWESGTPGAVAVMLLSTPETLGLTACMRLSMETDPATNVQQFQTLAGFEWMSGIYNPYDSLDLVPGDKQILLSTGPFDLAPDSTVTFWYAVIGSPFGEWAQTPPLRDTSELAVRCKWALEFWRLLFPGIAEDAPVADVRKANGPTIVRGVLFLPRDMTELPGNSDRVPRLSLLDFSGREVMNLKSGANDVRALAPGVYFMRDEPQASSREPQAVRKVVITR